MIEVKEKIEANNVTIIIDSKNDAYANFYFEEDGKKYSRINGLNLSKNEPYAFNLDDLIDFNKIK
jgi:hypothetical protein